MDFEQVEFEQTEKRAFQVQRIGYEGPGNEIEMAGLTTDLLLNNRE